MFGAQMERFGYIESRLFWENGVTARNLGEAFGVSRQTAQKILDDFRAAYPEAMRYNPRTKRHEATPSFEPRLIRTDPLIFLDYLRGNMLVERYREESEWSDFEVTDVNHLFRPRLSSEAVRPVLSALRNRKAILIDYRKKDLEGDESGDRVISPHRLIFADNRYHVRAYCHVKHGFLDFVLSRIASAKATGEEWVSSHEDWEWHERMTLRLAPHPGLPESVRTAILRGRETDEPGVWAITCRRALAFYVLRHLVDTVDPKYGSPLWFRL